MPLLNPYGSRDVKRSHNRLTISNFDENLALDDCPTATYIIKDTKNFTKMLRNDRNGKWTKLGLHVLECSICRGANVSEPTKRHNVLTSRLIEIEIPVEDLLHKWKLASGNRLATDSQAIQILLLENSSLKRIIEDLKRGKI